MTTTTTMTEVRIPATRYEDHDDCLAAAAADYAREHDLAGWDLSPRWDSEQREAIVLTVPAAKYAAIDHSGSGTVYGIGATEEAAIADALRGCRDLTGLVAVPCTARAAAYVETYGGEPDKHLDVSLRSGVCLREEE